MLRSFAKVWMLGFCWLVLWTPASRVSAQTFEEGYQSYLRNQFPQAEIQFRESLKVAKTKEDKAFISKFIGICQFMRGDRRGAAVSFYQAVQLDRSVTIDEEEVLDPSVIAFFQGIKSRVPVEAAPAASPPQAAAAPKLAKPTPKVMPPKKEAAATETSEPTGNRSSFSWMYLLPFGAGQFANESYLLGTAVAGAQAFAIYRSLDLARKIDRQATVVSNYDADPNATAEDKNDFRIVSSDYVEALKRDKSLAEAGFIGIWLISGVQAYFAGSSMTPAKATTVGSHSSTSIRPLQKLETMWLPTKEGATFVLSWKTSLP